MKEVARPHVRVCEYRSRHASAAHVHVRGARAYTHNAEELDSQLTLTHEYRAATLQATPLFLVRKESTIIAQPCLSMRV